MKGSGGVSNCDSSKSFGDLCFASVTKLGGENLSGGEELDGITVSTETGVVVLEGIAAASVRSLKGGGGGRFRRGGRGGGSMDGVERHAEYTIDLVISLSVSIRGRLGGYIEGVDGADDGTGESIRRFAVVANPVKSLEVRSVAK